LNVSCFEVVTIEPILHQHCRVGRPPFSASVLTSFEGHNLVIAALSEGWVREDANPMGDCLFPVVERDVIVSL
jgi:hypothetical protein